MSDLWFDDFMRLAGAVVLYWMLVVAIAQLLL